MAPPSVPPSLITTQEQQKHKQEAKSMNIEQRAKEQENHHHIFSNEAHLLIGVQPEGQPRGGGGGVQGEEVNSIVNITNPSSIIEQQPVLGTDKLKGIRSTKLCIH